MTSPNTSIVLTPRAEREQRAFRTLLTCMSRPGVIGHLGVQPDGAAVPDFSRPPSEGGRGSFPLLILEALVDHEVTFCVVPERTELSDIVLRQTGSRLAALADADYVLCDGASLPEVLRRSKDGTLEYPDRGATVVCLVQNISTSGEGEPLVLAGPGIKDTTRLWVEGFGAAARAAFAERNADVPLGVDLVLVASNGAVCCLTRYTRLELGATRNDATAASDATGAASEGAWGSSPSSIQEVS